MNFIRLVKTPRFDPPPKKPKKPHPSNETRISFIFTITTDFSTFASNADVSCQLVDTEGVVWERIVQWHDADREVKVEFPVPKTFKQGTLLLQPRTVVSVNRQGDFLSRYLGTPSTHLVSLETQPFTISDLSRQDTVHRTFLLPSGTLRIAEQTGETIIRHVWDAGIIFSALIAYNSLPSLPDELRQFVAETWSPRTRVLELGSGVGILGLSLAAQFPQVRVTLTDLPDAESLVRENISLNTAVFAHLAWTTQFRALDWEARPFPEWTQQEKFDVVVMADVTYNAATFIPLVETLVRVVKPETKVLCCGKRRHAEEMGFWRIVKERGIRVDKQLVYAMDLDGNFNVPRSEGNTYSEQVVDFICMSMA
jgi:2-polyprenyl-3-methyl-5-hydroxy-6-metoxy-1,4-benzoquinol methylase